MKKLLIAITLTAIGVSLTHSSPNEPTCTIVNGAITDTATCRTQADKLTVKIFEIGLCTSQPTAPTASIAVNLSACQKIYTNDSGGLVTITGATSTGLNGVFTRPPNGNYTFGYMVLGPEHAVQANLVFNSSRTVMGGASSGTHCWTKLGNMWRLDAQTSAYVECGNTVGNNIDLVTSEYNSLDGTGGSFLNSDSPSVGTNRYLVGNDLMLKPQPSSATSYGDITHQLITVALSPSIAISDSTTNIDVGFMSSRSAKIKFDGSGNIAFIKNGELGVRLIAN